MVFLSKYFFYYRGIIITNSPKRYVTRSDAQTRTGDLYHMCMSLNLLLCPASSSSSAYIRAAAHNSRSYLWPDGLWCLTGGPRWVGEWDLHVSLNREDIYQSDQGVNTEKQSIHLTSHRDPDLAATQLIK